MRSSLRHRSCCPARQRRPPEPHRRSGGFLMGLTDAECHGAYQFVRAHRERTFPDIETTLNRGRRDGILIASGSRTQCGWSTPNNPPRSPAARTTNLPLLELHPASGCCSPGASRVNRATPARHVRHPTPPARRDRWQLRGEYSQTGIPRSGRRSGLSF